MQSNIASACEVCSSSLHPPRRVGRLIAHTIERKTDRFPFASCRSPICRYDPMLIPDRPLARQSESNTEMKDEAGISVHRTMSLVDNQSRCRCLSEEERSEISPDEKLKCC